VTSVGFYRVAVQGLGIALLVGFVVLYRFQFDQGVVYCLLCGYLISGGAEHCSHRCFFNVNLHGRRSFTRRSHVGFSTTFGVVGSLFVVSKNCDGTGRSMSRSV
jgi:hypothetical protein